MPAVQRAPILGIPIAVSDEVEVVAEIERLYDADVAGLVAYVNAHTLNLAWRDADYRRVLREAELVLNDGVGVQLAARMRGFRFPSNLNGSDLTPKILERAAEKGWTVFLVGAAAGVAERAAEQLSASFPGLKIVGVHDGYFDSEDNATVVRSITESGATVVFAAMGNPRQEMWLDGNLAATGARLGVGVGAFLDFTVGAQRRAPGWMNSLGVEWAYRLLREPLRLWRRYLVGNPLFLLRAWKTRKAEREERRRSG